MFLLTFSLQVSIQGYFLPHPTQGNGQFVWYNIPCQYSLHKWLSVSVNVLAVAANSLIAVILCILLNYSRSGFQKWSHLFFSPYDLPIPSWRTLYLLRSDTIINKLVCTFVSPAILSFAALHDLTQKPICRWSVRSTRVYSPGEQKFCYLMTTWLNVQFCNVVFFPWLL